jgi:5-methylcytosine-specific restriction endonuclease McrA
VQGRIKRKQTEARNAWPLAHAGAQADPVCPLCDRPIPASQRDAHHLVPRSRGGVETVWLHRICHRQVHALFTEAELERHYANADALRSHPEMARFLDWVRRKPGDFFERTRKSQRLRGR